jgi:hypothetical protein
MVNAKLADKYIAPDGGPPHGKLTAAVRAGDARIVARFLYFANREHAAFGEITPLEALLAFSRLTGLPPETMTALFSDDPA